MRSRTAEWAFHADDLFFLSFEYASLLKSYSVVTLRTERENRNSGLDGESMFNQIIFQLLVRRQQVKLKLLVCGFGFLFKYVESSPSFEEVSARVEGSAH